MFTMSNVIDIELSTRERLITATADLFAEKGYRTRVQDIARTAGFTAGAVYVHFTSLHELLETAILHRAAAALDGATSEHEITDLADLVFVTEAVAITARTRQPNKFIDALADYHDRHAADYPDPVYELLGQTATAALNHITA